MARAARVAAGPGRSRSRRPSIGTPRTARGREYHARTGELPEAFARKSGLQASEYTSDVRASATRKPAVVKTAKRSKRARRRKSGVKASDGDASETKPAEAEAEAEAGSSDDEGDRYSSSDEERDVEAEPEPAPARDSENGPIATPRRVLGCVRAPGDRSHSPPSRSAYEPRHRRQVGVMGGRCGAAGPR